MVGLNALTILQKTKQIYSMSLLARGVLAFTTAASVQEFTIPNETSKLLISGAFSLGSLIIVELFKYIKARIPKKSNQTNVTDTDKNNKNQSREISLIPDNL